MIHGPIKIYKCTNCDNKFSMKSLISGNTFGRRFYSDGNSFSTMSPSFPALTKCEKCSAFIWFAKMEVIEEIEYEKCVPFLLINGSYDLAKPNPILNKYSKARSLTLEEYFEALNAKIYETNNDEKYIRIQIWHKYNNYVRGVPGETITGDEDEEDFKRFYKTFLIRNLNPKNIQDREKLIDYGMFKDVSDIERWEDNIRRLIILLGYNIIKNKEMIADFNRKRLQDESTWGFTTSNMIYIEKYIMQAELYRNIGAFDSSLKILNSLNEDKIKQVKEILIEENKKENPWVIRI